MTPCPGLADLKGPAGQADRVPGGVDEDDASGVGLDRGDGDLTGREDDPRGRGASLPFGLCLGQGRGEGVWRVRLEGELPFLAA
ncbi:MAG TPA: hypothetical protein DGR79_08285 [Clostridiales bacterium]|nr:hypothetical protein [Clostridiales bacterium]